MKKHQHISVANELPDQSGAGARIIRKAVKIGCFVNLLLMILKLSTGHWGHSDALMADGFHSLNDVAADLIMLIFVGISYRPANASYSYGYGKFETLSSLLMSSLLIFIGVMVGIEAIETVIDYAKGADLVQPDIWTFVVVLFAMACKEGLYRYYSRAGRQANSKALMANAWHHRSDALASVATLIGVTAAHFFGPAFRVLDPVASFVIAIFILTAAVRMFIPAFVELMEHSLPEHEIEKAREIVKNTPGVKEITYIRSRRNGHHLIFDIGIGVNPDLTISQGAEIADNIESEIKNAYCPHVYVSMNTRPVFN